MSRESKATKEEIQRNRDEAYLNGWGDGYAEGFAKATEAAIDRMTDERDNLSDKLNLERALTDGAHRRANAALAASDAKVAKILEALKVARAHVANNADGWSVSRGAARVDLTIVDAAITEAEQNKPKT